jgi:hypothetical protein
VLLGRVEDNVNKRPSIYATLTKEVDLNPDLAMLGGRSLKNFSLQSVLAGYIVKRKTTG